MTYNYDSHGWFSPVEIPNRTTEVAPPSHGAAPVVGQPWPNWTGVEWVMISYAEPVIPPAPVADKWVTLLAFRELFTQGEKIAIYDAARANSGVQVWLDDVAAVQSQMVNLSDPHTVAGVNAMEFGGLIGPGRAAEILA